MHFGRACEQFGAVANGVDHEVVASAQDLGKAGRDDMYGYGLVQAKAAYDRIRSLGCGN